MYICVYIYIYIYMYMYIYIYIYICDVHGEESSQLNLPTGARLFQGVFGSRQATRPPHKL